MRRILLIMIGASMLLHSTFSRDSSGVVTDSVTGLAWQDDYADNGGELKTAIWQDALVYCEELSLGTHNNWRLPNIVELKSIVDESKVNPAISSIFQNVSPYSYWSSTTSGVSSSTVWVVYFYNGKDKGGRSKTNQHSFRCVRGGQ